MDVLHSWTLFPSNIRGIRPTEHPVVIAVNDSPALVHRFGAYLHLDEGPVEAFMDHVLFDAAADVASIIYFYY